MKTAYFPFTYLSESTARLLAALVGPMVVYQPIESAVGSDLDQLASQGLVEIRAPLVDGDDRLRAALAEFTEWARQNPSRSTAGTDFLGARQGEIPFFDETAVNQIRSDLRQYGQPGHPAKERDDGFSARLFLALAQENDRAVDGLDRDLDRFTLMEKAFMDDLTDADEAGFVRKAHGTILWREDPGARLTAQRLRAWARVAAADDRIPDVLVTTSPAVIDRLSDSAGSGGAFEMLTDVRTTVPAEREDPLLARVLGGLLDGSLALTADLAEAGLPPITAESTIRIRLYATATQPARTFIDGLAGSESKPEHPSTAGHTVVVLVEC